jgi:hypothetical protein
MDGKWVILYTLLCLQQIMFYFIDTPFIITPLSCISNKLSHSDFLTKI